MTGITLDLETDLGRTAILIIMNLIIHEYGLSNTLENMCNLRKYGAMILLCQWLSYKQSMTDGS